MLEYELCMYVNHHRSKLNSTSQKFKLYYISKQGFQEFHKIANEQNSWLHTFEINNVYSYVLYFKCTIGKNATLVIWTMKFLCENMIATYVAIATNI